MASVLIEFGANPGQEDYEGLSPYAMAEQRADERFMRIFTAPGVMRSEGFGGCWIFNIFKRKPDSAMLPLMDAPEFL
jgi:hypothetical protein